MICAVSKLMSTKTVTTTLKKHVIVVYLKKTCLLDNKSNKQGFYQLGIYISIKPKIIVIRKDCVSSFFFYFEQTTQAISCDDVNGGHGREPQAAWTG